jgi:hypothetical protein
VTSDKRKDVSRRPPVARTSRSYPECRSGSDRDVINAPSAPTLASPGGDPNSERIREQAFDAHSPTIILKILNLDL